MVKLKRNGKIKASTLLETIIALTIIVIVFGIGLSVLNDQMRTENMQVQFKGNILIEKYFKNVTDTSGQHNFYDDGFQIERNFYPYDKDTSLVVVVVKVYDERNKLITKQKEILFLNNPGTSK